MCVLLIVLVFDIQIWELLCKKKKGAYKVVG
jgi:hypothetical protein